MAHPELTIPDHVRAQAGDRWGKVALGEEARAHLEPFLEKVKPHLTSKATAGGGFTIGSNGRFKEGQEEWGPDFDEVTRGVRQATGWNLHQWELRISGEDSRGLGPHADSRVYGVGLKAASLAVEKTGTVGLWLVPTDVLDDRENRGALRLGSYEDPYDAEVTLKDKEGSPVSVRPFHVMDLGVGEIFTSDETNIPWTDDQGVSWTLLHSAGGPQGRKALVGRQIGTSEIIVMGNSSGKDA